MLQRGRQLGMQRIDDAVVALVEAGTITPRAAFLKAIDKSRFEPLIEPG